jgi:anti-anti-sigma factor
MEFDIDKQQLYTVVSSSEEKLNALNAPELKTVFVQLNKDNVNNIILNLSATNYCDSSGLSSILTANRLCKDTNGKFILCGLQPNVLKMIQIAQLDRVLNIEDSLPDAKGVFNS